MEHKTKVILLLHLCSLHHCNKCLFIYSSNNPPIQDLILEVRQSANLEIRHQSHDYVWQPSHGTQVAIASELSATTGCAVLVNISSLNVPDYVISSPFIYHSAG